MKPQVYIRADANKLIGLGHIVRCVALAHMIRSNFDVAFVCIDVPEAIATDITNDGFQVIIISSEGSFFNKVSINDIVVLDGYNFNIEYQIELKKRCNKLVFIDDLHNQQFVADLVINHAPGVEKRNYDAKPFTRFALGPKYALLRNVFLQHANKKVVKKANNDNHTVLICFGGLDHKNLSLVALQAVLKFNEFKKIILITGASYAYFNEIEPVLNKNKNINYYHAITENSMADLMSQADVCILPSSGILLEALAIRTKIISGMYADNQSLLFERYKNAGAFISAKNFMPADLNYAIECYFSESRTLKKFFDGLSGKRLLTKFIELGLNVRRASAKDRLLLFNWANDKNVRANAINKQSIVWEDHINWFNVKLNSPDTFFFILGYFDLAVGQIRFDKGDDNFWVIDYSIDKNYRGKGLGKYILKSTLSHLKGQKLKAYVIENNLSSVRVFEGLNFISKASQIIGNEIYKVYELYL